MTLLKKILGLLTSNTESNSVNNHQAQFKPSTTGTGANPLHNEEVSCTPTGTFDVIVVGVYFHQEALEKICRNKREEDIEMIMRAEIVPEEGNCYDSNAVRIEIEGETVGHLSRQNALKWRGKMISEGISGAVTCPAKIRWDRNTLAAGSYGVWLDLDLTLSDSVPVINTNENQQDPDFQRFLQADGLIFFVDNFSIQDTTRTGMSVKLWIPKVKDPDTVYIYDRSAPYGPFGIVPSKYSDIVASHLLSAMNYDARIVKLTYNTCKIKCKLFSREEDERRKEEHKASLKEELTKSYKPKKPIMLTIAVEKKKGIRVGDKLTIEFEDSHSYGGPYSYPYQVKFLNQAGHTIGILDNNKSIIQRLLKAHFNSFVFDVEVVDIAKDIAWKGYPTKLVITPYKSHDGKSRGVVC